MSEAVQTAASAAKGAVDTAKASLGAVDPTSEIIANAKNHPSAQKLISAVQSHGMALVEAVEALVHAIDFDKVAASQAAGSHAGNAHIDTTKLAQATGSLKKAADLSAVVEAVNGLAADTALTDEMKKGFAAKGLTDGYDDVRGALKSVKVDQIGVVQHLEQIIDRAKAESSQDTPALQHLHGELQDIDTKLKSELSDLMTAVDGFLGKLAA
ncbi:hypothetical protein [Salinarimonas ramus]|uniref:Uncharacterized protein n=1 Tax=Salinarimonas ramus TaxID=690164 RepID=A0A917QG30_9HYPH|nr:hypothetical protein [Salinarimonas ramus]GGK48875.1 hypothetical protein GCM10011322_39880 [Salinarimonas ramus]